MPALNFVAVEDGLEEDPKLLGLARILRVPRSVAVFWVVRLRRLILHRGNHIVGSLPKDFRAADIASYLDFRGNPRRLVDAMKSQGFLGFKKGRGFYYPGWLDTTTGYYAHRREDDRSRKEAERRERRSVVQHRPEDVPGRSADASADRPGTYSEDQIGRKEPSNSESPPDPPPAGGDSLADARWEWLRAHAQRPQNRDACKKMLAAMSEADWEVLQRSYNLLTEPGVHIPRNDRRALAAPTDQVLRKQAYLRLQNVQRPSRTTLKPPTSEALSESPEQTEARRVAADEFVRQLLRDPDVTESKKAVARSRWLDDPQNKGRVPPWEISPEGSP